MVRYRIKSRQKFGLNHFTMGIHSEFYKKSRYYVQCKYKCIPFWITIGSYFDSLEQAEEHIKLKLKEYQ